jgi:hypothetical protein
MIIHVTREIGEVFVYGANGNEVLVRSIFELQEVEKEVVRKVNDVKYLSQGQLIEYLYQMLEAAMPEEEEIEVRVY